MKVEYPAFASVGIVRLTDEQLANPMKHYHKNTEDLVYRGMNVDILLAFMACVKVMDRKEGRQVPFIQRLYQIPQCYFVWCESGKCCLVHRLPSEDRRLV